MEQVYFIHENDKDPKVFKCTISKFSQICKWGHFGTGQMQIEPSNSKKKKILLGITFYIEKHSLKQPFFKEKDTA